MQTTRASVSRSRKGPAKMMAVIVAACASFGWTVSETRTETMCLMTKGMDVVTFATGAAGQGYNQTAKLAYLGAAVCEKADLTVEINWRVLLANVRLRHGMACHCRTSSPPHRSGSKARTLEARGHGKHAVRVSRGAPPWTISPYGLRTAHHRLLLRCIRWKRKRRDGYHMLSYEDALAKPGCENVETAVRKRRIIFAGSPLVGTTRGYQNECTTFGQVGGQETGLGGLSRARAIVVQPAHRSATLDAGREEPG